MTWWSRLWRRSKLEQDLGRELQFHIEERISSLKSTGLREDEVRRRVRQEFGGIEQVKEECRDARGTRWLEDLLQDCRFAIRALGQQPLFTAIALATLGLGVGATTVMFTIINGVLLKPLTYPEPDRLLSLHERTEKYREDSSFAYLNFLDCQRESRSLRQMAAWRRQGGILSEPGDADYVSGRWISADLFSVFGVPLFRGRAFQSGEDRPGGTAVAIIGYTLWRTRFDGNSAAIGSRVVFDGTAYTIVGIAPEGFRLSGNVDIFTPLGQNVDPRMQNRDMHPGINVVARLGPGVMLPQAQAELKLIGEHLARAYPKSNAGRSIGAERLRQEMVGDVRPTLWLLLGSVSLVLLMACVNIASLLLARAVSRERELAMRIALGASRSRLIRQCLTESTVLALCGGALGLLIATVSNRPFLVLWPGGLPRVEEVHPDWRVLLFAAIVSMLCGLLFGLAPAFRAPMERLEQVLRAGSRTLAGSSRRLHTAFVITEITLALVLLIAAGMLGRMLLRISSLDPGLNPHNVLVTRVALSADALANPTQTRTRWADILNRVSGTPGVRSVAIADVVPMGGDTEEIGYWTTPSAPPADQMPFSQMNLVTPQYLKVMRIPLLRGRFFDEQDRIGNELVIVIDEVLARRAFHSSEAVGKRLWLEFLGPVRIIGVVGHVRHWGLDADDQAKIREQLYFPFAQIPDPFLRLTSTAMSLVIRTSGPPLNVIEAVRRQVRGTTRDQAIYDVETMEDIMSGTLAKQQFLLLLFGIFSALALVLACVGIYGVLAYLTTQRVPEIGVRMALGATRNEVLRLILRQSFGMVLAGICLGIAGSLFVGRLLERFVAGVQREDLLTFSTMSFVLLAASLLASFLPAHRASRIDPMAALRQE